MAKRILVLYYTRGVYPLRDTIRTHLYCWRTYGKHEVAHVNIAFGFPEATVRAFAPDVIILHTIYLSMRWSSYVFKTFTARCDPIASMDCTKIALPQDEFIHTDMLASYLGRIGVTHIGTCSYAQDWRTIYAKLWETHKHPERVEFRTVLTGYLDENTVARIERMKALREPRNIDVGYRAWKAEAWLGEHGMHKVWVADRSEEAAHRHGLSTDISMRNEDVLSGDDWFRFLLRCRSTVGVEGGASLCDSDGSVKAAVDAYLKEHPDAPFDEIRANCFRGRDHTLNLQCISPRHMEAVATETAQALVEGRYSDILEPDVDYIPIRRDYANIDDVMRKLADPDFCTAMTRRAYDRVVTSGKATYRTFVREMEEAIIDPAPPTREASNPIARKVAYLRLRARDRLNWAFTKLEVFYLANVNKPEGRRVEKAYKIALRYFGAP
jgi:hypothetical protein